jgi:hypothetical protein
MSRIQRQTNLFMSSASILSEHISYMENIAKVTPPRRLETLLQLLEMSGDQTILSPNARKGLNPFLIPLSIRKDGSILCYIRWPTQKDGMDLQLVRTTEV